MDFSEVWILTESRDLTQNLVNWPYIEYSDDMAILDLLSKISTQHSIHLQRVPSHVGLTGNGIADDLAKFVYADFVDTADSLSLKFIELFNKLTGIPINSSD